MKQWTVYFRDKNGSKASVVIEAEDRSGVFAELKKRGISAISVLRELLIRSRARWQVAVRRLRDED